jgi:hypothetical protein
MYILIPLSHNLPYWARLVNNASISWWTCSPSWRYRSERHRCDRISQTRLGSSPARASTRHRREGDLGQPSSGKRHSEGESAGMGMRMNPSGGNSTSTRPEELIDQGSAEVCLESTLIGDGLTSLGDDKRDWTAGLMHLLLIFLTVIGVMPGLQASPNRQLRYMIPFGQQPR